MLVSGVLIAVSFFVVLVCLAFLALLFIIDLFSGDNASQTNTSYSYDFNEHQNYWDADK